MLNSATENDSQPTSTPDSNGSVDEFVKSVAPAAQRVAQRLNVPVEAVIGQWGLETGWGKSVIPGTNNLGNIKDFSGNGTAATDNMTGSRDKYRTYQSVDQFADDFSNLVGGGRYKNVAGSRDAQSYFRNLQAGGYAEDPNYVQKGAMASAMAAETLKKAEVVPETQALAPQKTGAPDLSKAPKWADVQAKPEFAALSPEKQAEAKAAYFDYYIAPRAGQQSAALRQQFLQPANKSNQERTWLEAGADTGVQLAEGVNTILGAIPNLVAPESGVASFFNDNSQFWQDKQSEALKENISKADQAITAAGEDGLISQIAEASSQYFTDPALAARFVTTNLPSMIPGIGAAKLAQASALARSASAARAAKLATTAAGGVNAVLNAGGARGEAFEDIKRTLISQGMSPQEAEQRAIEDSRVVAAVGAATGFLSGKIGLEKAIVGGAGKGGLRAGAGALTKELVGEQIEEVGPKLTTNVQAAQYDNRSIGKDVGRTIVETAIGSGPGAVVAGGVTAYNTPNAEQTLTEDGRIEPTLGSDPAATPAAPAVDPAIQPTTQAADDIVRELALQAGIPESTVLPTQPQESPVADGAPSDQDVQDFAASRYQQLREKRDGARQTVMGENGPVDQDVPGTGLSAAEQNELSGLERARGDTTALRSLYGFDQSQPTVGETPITPEPGLFAEQENQNVQNDQQEQVNGAAPGSDAINGDGSANGTTSQQGPADQATAAQDGTESGQQYEGVPAQDAVASSLAERSDAELRQQLRDARDRGVQRQIGEELQRRKDAAAQPAAPKTEKERNQQADYSAKWFGTAQKAQEFIAKKRIGDTHEAVQAGPSRFEIKLKEQQQNGTQAPQAQQAETQRPAQERGTERQVGGNEQAQAQTATPTSPAEGLPAAGTSSQPVEATGVNDAPGTRYNTDANSKAADRLQALLDSFNAERNSRPGQARSNIRSAIEELRKPKTVVSVEAILGDASTALMKNFPAQAQVVDEVIDQIAGRATTKPEPQTEKEAKEKRETVLHEGKSGLVHDEEALQRRNLDLYKKPVSESSIELLGKETANMFAVASAKEAEASFDANGNFIGKKKYRAVITKFRGGVYMFNDLEEAKAFVDSYGQRKPKTEKEASAQRTTLDEQPASTDQFANNKLFTADKVAEARARMKSKLGRMNSGIDPELMVDGVTIAGAYIESGVRSFSAYSKAMIGDFGDKIRPYLRSFYEGVRHYPGLDTKGMTTPAEIDMMEKQGTAEHTKPAPGTEEAIGEKVAAPKRTKERKSGETTLRDDYGVSHIDGYDSQDESPSGPIKTQFLADTRKYLSEVASALQAKGFAPTADRKGKAMKTVNVNESGAAGSGDVSLAVFHPEMQRGIYITIGGTSLRGVVPSTKSGVNVMMRVTKAGDPYGGDQNRWMPVTLSSTELADLAATEVEKVATRDTQSTIAKPVSQAQTQETKGTNDGDARRSDSGNGNGSVARTESVGPTAASDERTSVDLAGGKPDQVQGTGEGKQTPAKAQKSDGPTANGQRVSDGLPDGARQSDGKAANGRTAADTVASNFTITDELNFAGQGAKTKYTNNVAAIRLLKQLEADGRQATAAEQATLAKYIGWGGMPQAFDQKNEKWSKEFAELKKLLTPEEYSTAVSSTRNAHYTAKPVVEAIWAGLDRIGFKNGAVLEPSLGSGNFFGLMPVAARGKSRLFGVEFDHITGGIAKQLYPQAKINAPVGFQEIKIAPESFDVAVGNPPFGSEQLYDKNHSEASKFKIHGFFFAKSVDTLKPGGVLSMVVSKGLMDANDAQGKAARAWLAERTRLLGAIRLPNSAFQENANTEVTTDIIFLQKLSDEVKPNTGEWNAMGEVKDRATGEAIPINKYFVANPSMMLGEMTLAGSMYRANEPTLSAREGDNLADLLAKSIEKLPQGVFKTGKTAFVEAAEKANKIATADDVREYGHFIKDGKLYQRMPDYNGERQSVPVAREGKELERMLGMIGLRDAVRQQLALEKNASSTEAAIEANRTALNKAYDDFVKKYGYLNAQTNKRLFSDDSDAALLLSLEGKWDKGVTEAVAKTTGQKPRQAKATKATIFTKRVQTPAASVTKANTAKEAMLASLNERGRIDRDFMVGLYGKSFDDIVGELGDLAFEEPGYGWVPADLYLSGNVKQALAVARKAAEVDARFSRNVVALMKVQPADINPSDIFVKIGSPWVALEDYNAFVAETFGGKVSGAFLPATGNWSVSVDGGTPTETNTTWGTERMGANRIVETLMGNKQVAVYDEYRDADGNTKRVLNADETAAAQGKADALAEAFQDWIWKDNDRRDRLSRSYNDTYNTNIPRKYDGSHLTLPGMNTAISLRPHQLNWVYRSLVEGKGLADHVVGAGKTFAIIAAMMEMRRLGLANKPMIVVPNHLVGQWAKDILALYPGANVLAASRKDFQKDRRKLLFSRIATGDWDMVVVAHSSFGRIPMPAETEQRILDEQLKELVDAVKQAKADKGKRSTVKDLEKAKVRIEEKLKKLADRKQDDALDFSDLGVDALSVDEAHEFKNLFYTTTLQGVAGLGSPQGSTRAFDMFIKTRYVSERAGGKNVFFATGTPVANSIAEVFHMQRFLQYDTLKARGIHNFDAWANTFGQSTSDWEMNAAGKFVQKTRFRKFANLPELKGIWGEVADTVTRADLIADAEKQGKRFPLPKVKTGKPQNVVTDRSDLQANFIGVPQQEMDANGKPKLDDNGQPIMKFKPGTIVHRLENWKEASKTNPKEIPLAITGQARKAGLDYRLIDENAPDFEGSKINAAVSRIVDTWKANDARKGTQLVFCDLSVPASAKGQATAEAAEKVPTFFVKEGQGIKHVAGKLLTLASLPDVEVFSHKDGKKWLITERNTGLKFSEGSTKQEAIDAANSRAARVDPKWLQEKIASDSISQEQIDDYITRWEEQQAQAEDTNTDDESAEPAKEISLDEMLADGGGTFSVYDDIKAKLIRQGIPAEQIAFIHDYGTDDKKAALFAAVNNGDIRVLLGSTQKMGAGTNVQAKLVALHHMDAPWRPSDLEQREGRIIRQGNEFYEADPAGFEVDIYRYATKQTYDSRMWEIIETKARAIEQFKSDSSMREIEDVSSESANAAEIKAGASGNPLILDAITLAADLRKLQAMKKSWERSRFDLEKKIQQATSKTGWVYNGAKMAEDFAATVSPKNKDALGLKVFGLTINSEKDVTSEVLASKMVEAATDTAGKKVGQYRGVDLYARRDSNGVTFFTSFRDYSVSSTTYGPQDKFSVSGFLTRMDNMADGAAKWKDQTAQAVVQFEKDAESAKRELTRGFPKQDELSSVSDKHKAVVAALRAGKTSLGGDVPGVARASTGQAGSVTRAQGDAVVNRITAKYDESWGVKVQLFDDKSTLPADVIAEYETQFEGGQAPKGFFKDGAVYAVLSEHSSTADLEETILHEIEGHVAMRVLFGARWVESMGTIYGALGGFEGMVRMLGRTNPEARANLEKYRDAIAKMTQNGVELSKPLQTAMFTEEVMAQVAEQKPTLYKKILELIGAVREFLRKNGFAELATYGETDIARLLAIGRKNLQQPKVSNKSSIDVPTIWSWSDPVRKIQNKAIQFFGNQDINTFNWYDKSISTQYNKALKDKHFGKVFSLLLGMQNHISMASIRAAELAPGVMPRVDSFSEAAKEIVSKRNQVALDSASQAIFAGTLDGENVMQGRVWTEDELRSRFGMDDTGVALYQQSRAAIDASLDEVAAAEAYAMAQSFVPKALRADVVDNPSNAEAALTTALKSQIKTMGQAIKAATTRGDEQQAKELAAARDGYKKTLRTVEKIFVTAKNLKAAGYAPLMRFGKFSVTVQAIDPATGNLERDDNGSAITMFFGRYETQSEARAAEAEVRAEYAGRDDVSISVGAVNDSKHELFKGVTPETLDLFAEAIGAKHAADEFIRLTRSERSALKRKLERKGTPGFSTDLQRVMASFITSNARHASQQLYAGAVNRAIKYIPKEKGDVQKEAQKLRDFVVNPDDAGSRLSSLMFAWFLGGSPAAAAVNMTQPVMMTLPYLSQYGATSAATELTKAVPYAMGKKEITDVDLRAALKKASLEGVVDAQEIFHLYSMGSRQLAMGTKSQAAMAIWGSMFAAVEGLNRRLTFIAAWNMAKINGEKNPYAFSVRAVNQTQGIYNKVNRPNLARSSLGRAVFTFKQFGVMYGELAVRMWKSGPEGKRAVLLMLAILTLAAGEEGLPGSKMLDDLIDTIGQMLGFNTSARLWKRRKAYEILGKEAGDMFLYGLSSHLPLDFGGRLGLGSIVPGTEMFKPSSGVFNTRALAEVLGPSVGAGMQIGDAAEAAQEGNYKQAAINLAPKAVKDLASAAAMAKRGYQTDIKGNKVVDTTATDAVVKAIGFNPTVVAQENRKTMPLQQRINFAEQKEASIVDQWARARVDNDEAGMAAAMKRKDDWNEANPETKIRIDSDQLRSKARKMATDKDTRLRKSAPRELRGSLGLDLAE